MRPARGDWTRWGCTAARTSTDRRKVFNTNLSVAVSAASLLFFSVLYLALGHPVLRRIVLFNLPCLAALALVLWLNHRQRIHLARWIFCMSLSALISLNLWCAQGTFLCAHFYFLAIGFGACILFSPAQWPGLVLVFVLNLGAFAVAEYGQIAPDPSLRSLPGWQLTLLRACHYLFSLGTLFFLVMQSEYVASQSEARFESLSSTDALTGLPNRRQLMRVLSREWGRALRVQRPIALAMIDVDLFKLYNDHHGHQAGDRCLQQVAAALEACLRRHGDLVARYGGEEFVLVMSDTSTAQALAIGATVCRAVRALDLPHRALPSGCVTVSVGVAACTPQPGADFEALLQEADAALYRAKQSGRDRVEGP